MSNTRFLLDENVDPDLQAGLQLKWSKMTVRRIGDSDAPQHQTPDPEILLWCEAQGFMLATYNRASMPLHLHLKDHLAADRHVPGIIMLNDSLSMGETIEALGEIWISDRPDKYLDQIIYLKPAIPHKTAKPHSRR